MTAFPYKEFLALWSSHLITWICLARPFCLARSLWIGLTLLWCLYAVCKDSLPLNCPWMASLVLRFVSFLFSLTLGGVFSASRTQMLVSFSRLGRFSATICSNISFSLSVCPLRDPRNSDIVTFHGFVKNISPSLLFLLIPSLIPKILTLECFIVSLISLSLFS